MTHIWDCLPPRPRCSKKPALIHILYNSTQGCTPVMTLIAAYWQWYHMAMSQLFGCMDCPPPGSHFGTWKILESDMGKYAHPLSRVDAIFVFASQPRLNLLST